MPTQKPFDRTAFILDISQGHPGVAGGLGDAFTKIPEGILVAIILAMNKKGQALYNVYGEWLRADDERFEANPTFSDYLVDRVLKADKLACVVKEVVKD